MFLIQDNTIVNVDQIKYISLENDLGYWLRIFFISGGDTCLKFETEKERYKFCLKILDIL